MINFQEYKQNIEAYRTNEKKIKSIIDKFEKDNIFISEYGENDGTLKIPVSMTTKELKETEKTYNVIFKLGGQDFVKFEFNPENNNKNYDKCMMLLRALQKKNYDIYHEYFADILKDMYHHYRFCNKGVTIKLSTQFWGFHIKCLNELTVDELIQIEKETGATFKNYNITTGYKFIFEEKQ